jgi:DNA-directed RNA polymerase subunit RPC12/RpoP
MLSLKWEVELKNGVGLQFIYHGEDEQHWRLSKMKEAILYICRRCRQRVPLPGSQTISSNEEGERIIGKCPHCGELAFDVVNVEVIGGMTGVTGNVYAEPIELPDGCIAVFDEEEHNFTEVVRGWSLEGRRTERSGIDKNLPKNSLHSV